jgi:hypothetical protein
VQRYILQNQWERSFPFLYHISFAAKLDNLQIGKPTQLEQVLYKHHSAAMQESWCALPALLRSFSTTHKSIRVQCQLRELKIVETTYTERL